MNEKKETYKEVIRYVITGGMTTAVNFIIYWITTRFIGLYWVSANVLAWLGAVIFAYGMNQRFVFQMDEDHNWKQAGQFFCLRLVTLLIETVLLWITISWMKMPDMLAKVIVSVVTIVGNYGFCKIVIFAERKEGGNENE